MANNEKSLQRLFLECKKLDEGDINFIDFIDNCEKILYNDTSSSVVQYFSDGWTEGSASNIMKYVLKAYFGDRKALERLKVDFGIEEHNIEIKEL